MQDILSTCTMHVNIIILHVDLTILHANVFILHVDIIDRKIICPQGADVCQLKNYILFMNLQTNYSLR